MFADREALFAIKLSLKVSLISTMLVVLIGTPLAYIFARSRFRMKGLLETLFMLPVVFAPTVTGYLLLLVIGRRGPLGKLIHELFGSTILFTWHAAVLAAFVASFPLFFKTVKAAFEGVDPEYIFVSYTLGRGRLYTFFRVVLPMAKPGILAGTGLAFARSFGEFGITLMLAGNIPFKTTTLPIEIYNAVSEGQFHRANLLAAIAAAVSVSLLILINRVTEKWLK